MMTMDDICPNCAMNRHEECPKISADRTTCCCGKHKFETPGQSDVIPGKEGSTGVSVSELNI